MFHGLVFPVAMLFHGRSTRRRFRPGRREHSDAWPE